MTDVRRSVWAFGAAAVLMGAGLAEGAATLHRLGSLPGAPVVTSHGRALSADGSTVVGQAPTSDGPRAFAGGPGGLMNLGNLDGASDAYGASADGSVVVGNAWVEPIGFLAFRSTETGGIVSLGSIGFNSSGHEQSEALAVSADGSVVVGRSSSPAAGANFEAFRWTQQGGMVGLGGFPGEAVNSTARAVSADGNTIVGEAQVGPAFRAFKWTQATGMVDLGDVGGEPFATRANGVSADGRYAVGYVGSNFAQRPALFRPDGSVLVLEGNGIAYAYGEAHAVSGDGSIVVGTFWSDEIGARAFIWTAAGGMRDLNEWVRTEHGVDPGNFVLFNAFGVSTDGRVIAGMMHPLDGEGHPGPPQEAFMIRIEAPPCRADFDQQNGVQVADIFAFLRAWFANSPSADFDGTNGIQVADIFAFLRAWFAGC